MSISNYLYLHFFSQFLTQNFPNSTSHKNEIFYLSWRISKSFNRIWEVEVSKSKPMSKYTESKNIVTMEQKATVQWFAK